MKTVSPNLEYRYIFFSLDFGGRSDQIPTSTRGTMTDKSEDVPEEEKVRRRFQMMMMGLPGRFQMNSLLSRPLIEINVIRTIHRTDLILD